MSAGEQLQPVATAAMDQGWLTSLIADAELVADASLRLTNTVQSTLLNAISLARKANSSETCEAAYRALQTELPPVLLALKPITIFDLQQSWVLHQGFRPKKSQLYSFWLVCVILLFTVAYTTSTYNRVAEIAETLLSFKDVRLAEQGVRVFNLARQHKEAIVKAQSDNEQSLASESFFRALTDLQATQNHISAATTAANQISAELQLAARAGYGLCRLSQALISLGGGNYFCLDPNYSAVAALGIAIKTEGYSNVPPADLASTNKKPPLSMPELVAYLDSADQFFQDVGAGLVQTRQNLLMFDYLLRDINRLLDALRAWIVPAAYGSLGAAIFFTRRFLDPMFPNPDPLRVIYRILFGGFAGIIFAWFWSPAANLAAPGSTVSFSSFAVAFLAGYATDIFFQLLDKLVNTITHQLQSKAEPGS